MNKFLTFLGAAAFALPAFAMAPPPPAALGTPPPVYMPVQANCNAVGQQIASQQGGTLAKASPEQRGGRTVCVIVVLLPAKDGQRPRREEHVVPQ